MDVRLIMMMMKFKTIEFKNHLIAKFYNANQPSLPFCSSADHFAGTEYKCSSPWISDSHDYSSETFRIIFGISSVQRYLFQI